MSPNMLFVTITSIQFLAVFEPLPKLDRLGGQLLVAQLLQLGLEGIDFGNPLLEPFEGAALSSPQDLLMKTLIAVGWYQPHGWPSLARPLTRRQRLLDQSRTARRGAYR